MRHNIPRLGASLAFYTTLSLAPLLVVIVAIAGLAFSRSDAVGQIVWQMNALVGHDGAQVIKTLLNGARKPASGAIATGLGLITLFIGASTVVAELKDAMNTIWELPSRRNERVFQSAIRLLKTRLISFAMVLGIGFLLMVSLAVNAAVTALGGTYGNYLPPEAWVLQTADVVISFLVIAALFAALFKVLPDIRIAWADVFLGSVMTAALFTAGKFVIGLYLGRATITSTYGAAGSLVVLLIWMYYSAQIFYAGAEFTHAYAELYGSRPSEHRGGVKVETHIPEALRPGDAKIALHH